MFLNINIIRMLRTLRSLSNQYYIDWKKRLGESHKTTLIENPTRIVGPENVFMAENTTIKRALIMTPKCKFIMKRHSGSAPGLTVLTGNHMRIIGRFWDTVKQEDKPDGFDKDIIVEEDCWLGANVTLLQGIVVRRGTNIAAGAVVSKSTIPYSVYGGIPARLISVYWTVDEILEHEQKLYPESERYSREELEAFYNNIV